MSDRNRYRMVLPERRQHTRIVTLRNFAWLTLALLLGFAAISLRSELRGRHMNDYGRLVARQIEREPVAPKPVDVVEESTAAPASTRSEPMEVVSLDAPQPPQQQQPVVSSQIVAPVRGGARVGIVGGPEGVTVVQQTQKRPLLKGGFGR